MIACLRGGGQSSRIDEEQLWHARAAGSTTATATGDSDRRQATGDALGWGKPGCSAAAASRA